MTLMIKPASSQCNMRCDYCFYRDEAARREIPDCGRMSFATLENTVRRAMAFADGEAHFVFQGGEPTLADTDFFRVAVKLQKKYNTRGIAVSNSVQTNGLDVPEDMMRLFAQERFLVGVSLDGTKQTHEAHRGKTYDRVKANLDRMLAMGVSCNALCVITKDVARNAAAVYEALAPYRYVQFIPCMDAMTGETSEYSLTNTDYAQFLLEPLPLYTKGGVSVRMFDNWKGILHGAAPEQCGMCGRCTQYFLVEADGSVYPCDFYALDEWRLGNVNTASFVKMAKSETQDRFIARSLPVPETCRACEWYFLCRNGCKRERDENGVYRFCAAHKQALPVIARALR